jgi:hypothetical protein
MDSAKFREWAHSLRDETRMVGSTVLGLLAGRTVWLPPEKAADLSWIDQVPKQNLDAALDLYKDRLITESSGVEAVRRRAEFALTAVIAALGLSATLLERLWTVGADWKWLTLLWGAGVVVVGLAILVFGGVAVAKKAMGALQEPHFLVRRNPRREQLRQYVDAIRTTSRTRRAMVTVFRDGFLLGLLGLALLGSAHVISWMAPVEEPSASLFFIIETCSRG